MFASLLITFRETLEAALIIGIVLAHLNTLGKEQFNKYVWAGLWAGIGTSVLLALAFDRLFGGFTGRTEEIFEGVFMLLGALLITTLIMWMMKRNHIGKELRTKVDTHIAKKETFELFSVVFVAVLREGIEVVLFLSALTVTLEGGTMLGAMLGFPFAAILGYLLYKKLIRLNIKKFFTITGILLILFAAGLVAHGVHELQEAHIFPTIIEHVWDINPLLNEKGTFGSILKGLFGYNGNPSLLEVLSYVLYMTGLTWYWKKMS